MNTYENLQYIKAILSPRYSNAWSLPRLIRVLSAAHRYDAAHRWRQVQAQDPLYIMDMEFNQGVELINTALANRKLPVLRTVESLP